MAHKQRKLLIFTKDIMLNSGVSPEHITYHMPYVVTFVCTRKAQKQEANFPKLNGPLAKLSGCT